MIKRIGVISLCGLLTVSSFAYAEVYQKRNADGSVTFTDDSSGASKADLAPISISGDSRPAESSTPDGAANQNAAAAAPVEQYQSLVFTQSADPLANLYSNPNMGLSVSAILTPQLHPDDQVDLLYNGKILVRATTKAAQVNLDALYSSSNRDDELINRLPPKASLQVVNEGDTSRLTFNLQRLTRVNFPQGMHVWQMRVVGPDGQKVKIESQTRQFNVVYAEERKKPVKLIFSDKTFLVVRTVVHLVANALSPI